jgi:hypothetical protein
VNTRTGQCQCTAVGFAFDGEPTDASFCHCSLCRRLSGSAFGAYIEVADSEFRITSGMDRLSRYKVTQNLESLFCGTCGASVYMTHARFPGYTYISLGALIDDHGIAPQYHQFVGSKAGWHEISDALPQFEEWPEE